MIKDPNWCYNLAVLRDLTLSTCEMRGLSSEAGQQALACSIQLAIAERVESISGSLIEMTEVLNAIRNNLRSIRAGE